MLAPITFETPRWRVAALEAAGYVKYSILRPLVSAALYYARDRPRHLLVERTIEGEPLLEGVSVYIPCRNEAATLRLALGGLLGIVNQFILIDNGSEDGTLAIMEEFARVEGGRVRVDVVSMPRALLVEMVQHALSLVRHRWVLKWDGDMLAARGSLSRLCASLPSILRPTAFQLPRLNFTGDLRHVSRVFPSVDAGEPFLRTFNNRFQFSEEFGRLEHAIIPLYYRLCRAGAASEVFSYHFTNLRPPLRILYRHCYLDWRQTLNLGGDEARARYSELATFRRDWLIHNMGTDDESSARFRVGRLIASDTRPVDVGGDVRADLERAGAEGLDRFEIRYRDGRPWLMVDHADPACMSYEPTAADLSWIPDISRFHLDSVRLAFVKPGPETPRE